MLALALFFMLIIVLLLLAIPLLKSVLADYALTLTTSSKRIREAQINATQQDINQTIQRREKELDELLYPETNKRTETFNPDDLLQSLGIYLQSILKVFKSEESTP